MPRKRLYHTAAEIREANRLKSARYYARHKDKINAKRRLKGSRKADHGQSDIERAGRSVERSIDNSQAIVNALHVEDNTTSHPCVPAQSHRFLSARTSQ
ncbi:hypothetical protein Moror_5500 [Moniliophthora roreri MCA 2997]|uniref:Uncharacterized protein n=1 Tax=Moniliophthora roreri (strain MCA 2997) TaxID=1381753 RepID=V2X6Z7_MONRO|nr:hypothetical protein Moror_5500 [Moniliophthora roreri MCA 2997]